MATTPCPACGGSSADAMGSVGPVPVLCGSLWDSREDALATPMANLDLAVCRRCAHVWNTTFDPTLVDYDAKYDNALDFSPTFRRYADGLVDHLVETFDLRGKRIAEIGSGKGEFLRQLCAAGQNRGVGYDPTHDDPDLDGDIEFVREFFAPETSRGDVDFVCCRHVLEHLADPVEFLLEVRAAVKDEPVPMYFEVPNAEFNFAESGPWDLIYPHVGYFSAQSLHALLTRAGLHINRIEPSFNGQFLSAEVVASSASALEVRSVSGVATWRRECFERQLTAAARWQERLHDWDAKGGIALWGAGSKGVTFLSLVDPGRTIAAVIDANPRKWQRYLPVTGHKVVSPEAVGMASVDAVLVMNPAYKREIELCLAAEGSRAEVVAA